MAGIMQKIEEKLHMGGGKGSEEKKHEGESEKHKSSEGVKKEGLMDKIKDKIPGGTQHGQEGEEKNKKKKKEKKNKKKKEDGHGHDSSSSSDSD